MEPVEIAAGAIQLQPWAPHDAREVFDACQDPAIQRWTTVPSPYTMADAQAFVGVITPAHWADGTAASFAVKDATSGRVLASVGLHELNSRDRSAELGFWAAPWARGTGVVTHASRVVCRWAFESGVTDHIRWIAGIGNEASLRVAQKVGFTIDGSLRSRIRLGDGTRHDALHGSLLPGEITGETR